MVYGSRTGKIFSWKWNIIFILILAILVVVAMGYFSATWGIYTFLAVLVIFAGVVQAFLIPTPVYGGAQWSAYIFIICLALAMVLFFMGMYAGEVTTQIVDLSFIHNLFI